MTHRVIIAQQHKHVITFQIVLYLTGQSLILFHHFLILLVHTEHLTDPVGSRLCLREKQGHTERHAPTGPLQYLQ